LDDIIYILIIAKFEFILSKFMIDIQRNQLKSTIKGVLDKILYKIYF